MKYKYLTIRLVAVVAVSVTFIAEGQSEKKPAVLTMQIVAMQAKEFALPDKIEMVIIPAGKFTMGSPKGEVGRGDDETQRTITITKPFYMTKYEIRQNQYIPLMCPDYKPIFTGKGAWGQSPPELHQHGAWLSHRKPTEQAMDAVPWVHAVEFCKKLTAREKAASRLPEGYEYRLPTEAEWEYACRAGTTGAFNDERVEKTVDQIGRIQAEIMPGKAGRSDSIVNKGGVANTFGLMDMHMGMLEWVLDDYAPYAGDKATDPVVFTDGKSKGVRGGFDAFYEDPSPKGGVYTEPKEWRRYVRSASRGHLMPGMPYPCVGFRPVLAPVVKVPEVTIRDEYSIGVLRAEDTSIREADLAEFKKAMGTK